METSVHGWSASCKYYGINHLTTILNPPLLVSKKTSTKDKVGHISSISTTHITSLPIAHVSRLQC